MVRMNWDYGPNGSKGCNLTRGSSEVNPAWESKRSLFVERFSMNGISREQVLYKIFFTKENFFENFLTTVKNEKERHSEKF